MEEAADVAISAWRGSMAWRPGIYQECLAMSKWSATIEASVESISGIRPIPFTHAALANTLAAGKRVSRGHPYAAFIVGLVKHHPSLTHADVCAMRQTAFESIRDEGIRSPIEMFFDDGGFVYLHGHHRLAFAKRLGIEKIPCTVHACSSSLAALAARVFSLYSDNRRMTLYQPLEHSAFKLFPVQECNRLWDSKVAAIGAVAKGWAQCVEVGAHFGGLTRALHMVGVRSMAIDSARFHREIQPFLEATGHAAIPYATMKIEDLARAGLHERLVMIGLWHHYLGDPMLWETARRELLPWMRDCLPEMIVEMSLEQSYMGEAAARPVVSMSDACAFWRSWGFDARCIFSGTLNRHVFHCHKARLAD